MLMIRFQRIGRKNDPAFRIAVLEKTSGPKAGKYVEQIGSYNPKTKEFILNEERVSYWTGNGAQLSDSLHNLLVSKGVIQGKKINVLPKKTIPVVEAPAEASAPAPVAAEATPAAEAKVETTESPTETEAASEPTEVEVAADADVTEAEVAAEPEAASAEEVAVEETPAAE